MCFKVIVICSSILIIIVDFIKFIVGLEKIE